MLANSSEFLREQFPLYDAVFENEIYHADVRVKDCLEQDTSFNALYGYLSRDLLDGNIVRNLNQ